MNNRFSAIMGFLLFTSVSVGMAQPPGRGGPPPEALKACSTLAKDDACQFEGRRGETFEGRCSAPPGHEEQIVCMPKDFSPGDGRQRPE